MSATQQFKILKENLSICLIKDRYRLSRQLSRLQDDLKKNKNIEKKLKSLVDQFEHSMTRVQQRLDAIPEVSFPDSLPVSLRVEDISKLITDNQVVILAGETGSGKTTQLPKICLNLGRGICGMIGHTQPRRLAARTVSARIAEELNVKPGQEVGYQMRFMDHTTDNTFIKIMTDGILLAETQNDRFLEKYDTIIIDEAHERSLNIDFLLGYIKRILPKRPDLKVIVTSATIDVERFSRHFNNAPVIEVSGRTFPVELLYRPPLLHNDQQLGGDKSSLSDADESEVHLSIIAAVKELMSLEKKRNLEPGDILIFISGERDIREVANVLRKQQFRHTEVLPLYARLSQAEQNRIFQQHRGRRIVLATNVAETSLTVPGIRYVIDPGLARISRYSYRTKVQRLPIEAISQASANQRKGRCGRVSEGICIRLYEEEDFNLRPEFTDAEIFRTNLASVILQMLNLRLGDIQQFPFVDKPDSRAVNDGYKLLEELGAINARRHLTAIGRQVAKFPLEPRFSRMVLEAVKQDCLKEILIIVSGLSIQDPRERPTEKQQAADEKHSRYKHIESDFLAYVKCWDYYEKHRQDYSQKQLRGFCREHFLSYTRMREWRDIHRQLHLLCEELNFKENSKPASYEAIHKAILSGLLSHIGNKMEAGEYLGARNRKFFIFPGSFLFKKRINWIVTAELVETSKLYARCVGKIEPEWIEPLATHLLNYQHNEPHWEKRKSQVVALQQLSLYGLIIIPSRKVHYGPIDPKRSREIFIQSALVEADLSTKADFFLHNRQLVADIERLEAKSRRRDILVEEYRLFEFYDARFPPDIYNGSTFERWLKSSNVQQRKKLFLSFEDLVQSETDSITDDLYPDSIKHQGMDFQLNYEFEPDQDQDGISVNIPVSALKQLSANQLDWLVPGLLKEKCIALIKCLPKQWRKHFVPVPDFVEKVLPRMSIKDGNVYTSLTQHLKYLTGVTIPLDAWQPEKLVNYLHLNIHVLDAKGNILESSRDLLALKKKYADVKVHGVQIAHQLEKQGITSWDFGDLPAVIDSQQAGIRIQLFPALQDKLDSVAIECVDSEFVANNTHKKGLIRLLILTLPQQQRYLKKQLLTDTQLLLHYSTVGNREQLLQDILSATFYKAFLHEQLLPRMEIEFKQCIQRGKANLVEAAQEMESLIKDVLHDYHQILKIINGGFPQTRSTCYGDIKFQLSKLIYKGFVSATPYHWLKYFPRYLQAILLRIDRIQGNLPKDNQYTNDLKDYWELYENRLTKHRIEGIDDPELALYRWMLEEYRVSVFAQTLKTHMPVSAKRLEKQWNKVVI